MSRFSLLQWFINFYQITNKKLLDESTLYLTDDKISSLFILRNVGWSKFWVRQRWHKLRGTRAWHIQSPKKRLRLNGRWWHKDHQSLLGKRLFLLRCIRRKASGKWCLIHRKSGIEFVLQSEHPLFAEFPEKCSIRRTWCPIRTLYRRFLDTQLV